MNVSVRLSATGTAPRQVVCGAEVEQLCRRIKGPMHSRTTRTVGETEIVDVFSASIIGYEETDAIQWVGPAYSDGTAYTIPDISVEFSAPNAPTTNMTITYQAVYGSGGIAFGFFLNGEFFRASVLIGSDFGS